MFYPISLICLSPELSIVSIKRTSVYCCVIVSPNLIIIFVLVIACGCSVIQRKPKNPDGTIKDTSELWSKSQAMQDIIKRSGTPFKGEAARESGLTERDAFNRLHSGGGLFGKKGLSLDMGENNQTQQTAAVGIPINPYLWRASLEYL